ncbi:hypothetical protein [Priestia sp. YIM B13486]|uniref:hypothetical protein n=1 Tax=Priestia sp. YIM B13486 TaxID=3366304 RepID=UPI00366F4FF9
MLNLLSYYEGVQDKFPISSYLIDFSMGLDVDSTEIEWLFNKGYSTIPHAIRRCKRVSPAEKIILEEIYMSMGFGLESTITRKALANLLDMGVDTVRANIRKLQEKKFLAVGEFNERYYYFVKSLSLNPYIIMSELTHYAKRSYLAKLPKSICDAGVQLRIEKLVKSEKYQEYINHILEDSSYRKIMLIKNDYFRFIEELIKTENKIDITIPEI